MLTRDENGYCMLHAGLIQIMTEPSRLFLCVMLMMLVADMIRH